ncbi:MAG: TonB-dependent receptor [Delftia acidovorans]|nr:TonB-dependent receptor [Delftia acidovorans]
MQATLHRAHHIRPVLNLQPTVVAATLALLGAAVHSPQSAWAQTSPAPQAYDIPSQPLGQTLTRIAAESGQPVSIDAELVRSITAPAVRGSYTPERAARAALAGSGLDLVRSGSGALTLMRRPAASVSSGKVLSQGLDMEVSGELARGVNLHAGYTYNHNRNRASNTAFSTITPRHLLKLWGTWQLPGQASPWKLGAGATVQSRQYVSGTAATWNDATARYDGPSVPYKYTQGGYAVWNLMAEYKIDPRWTLVAHLNNVLDKTYYRTVGTSVSGNYYGELRSMALTLRGRF